MASFFTRIFQRSKTHMQAHSQAPSQEQARARYQSRSLSSHRTSFSRRHDESSPPSRKNVWERSWVRYCLAASPIAGYIVMLIWMIIHKQWMYLVILLPTAIISCVTALSSLSRAHTSGSHNAHDALPAQSHSSPMPLSRNDLDDILLHDLVEISHHSLPLRAVPSWKDIVHSWLEPQQSVTLGSGPDYRPVMVNLSEHSPHALIAGTTGSGKSVLLQQWVYELACHNSPQEVNFIFLDFKGGATFLAARHLPHCVGSVSNLDLAHAARAVRAVHDEMIRREQLLAHHGVSTIDDLTVPLPHIYVIADEFFALTSARPEYAQEFSTLISLGRSLGIHCIICTQNPLTQVNTHIKANMPIHVCLRVVEPLQSLDLLGTTAAAKIPRSLLGGAFINDGNATTACIISQPPLSAPVSSTLPLLAQEQTQAKNPTAHTFSLSDRFIHACSWACRFMHIDAPSRLFDEPLPHDLSPSSPTTSSSHEIPIGESDTGICRSSYDLQIRFPQKAPVLLTDMSTSSMHANMSSILSSILRSGWSRERSHDYPCTSSNAEENDHGYSCIILEPPSSCQESSTCRIALVELTSTSSQSAQDAIHNFLHDPHIFLILATSSWSRFITPVPERDKPVWEESLLISGVHSSALNPRTHEAPPRDIHALIREYSSSHPHRAIVYSEKPQFIQFFSTNSRETLENFDGVWFPIVKED